MEPTIKGAQRLLGFDKPTVWTVMTPLAVKTNSINLGQGFPSWNPPDFYLKNFEDALKYSKFFFTQVLINILGPMVL